MSRKLRLIFHSDRCQENTKRFIKLSYDGLDSKHITRLKYVNLKELVQNPELQRAYKVKGQFCRGRISSRKLQNFITLPFHS